MRPSSKVKGSFEATSLDFCLNFASIFVLKPLSSLMTYSNFTLLIGPVIKIRVHSIVGNATSSEIGAIVGSSPTEPIIKNKILEDKI